jgi:glycosyltransferase involved in cell wall biosynthesis
MKCLMVSSYPPMKCGIGAYASQMVKSLQSHGDTVDILSPYEGDGTFKADLKGGFRILKLLTRAKGYERIIIQYHESFFFEAGSDTHTLNTIETQIAFLLLFIVMRHRVEVIIHEMPYSHSSRFFHFLEKVKWYACPKIIFHTQIEVDKFSSYYFLPGKSQHEIGKQDRYFLKYCDESKQESRMRLGLSSHSVIFLCIGFIQPHKGFDRALEAFRDTSRKMELYIVGTIRVESEENAHYLHQLKKTANQIENTNIVDKFLSDEEFDRWINASDIMVVPYREIWSSSVLARAKLFEKPVIACKTGGLENQTSSHDLLFMDDRELREIFLEFSSAIESDRNQRQVIYHYPEGI